MLKNITLTILGGLGLFIATLILNAFTSSPPTRAEFDSFKATQTLQIKTIHGTLKELKQGQNKIYDHLLQKGRK